VNFVLLAEDVIQVRDLQPAIAENANVPLTPWERPKPN
jgi:hypothetical protein